jgi:hypothetical protein
VVGELLKQLQQGFAPAQISTSGRCSTAACTNLLPVSSAALTKIPAACRSGTKLGALAGIFASSNAEIMAGSHGTAFA